MKNLLMTVLGMVIMSALTGCVVYSEPGRTGSSSSAVKSSSKSNGKSSSSHACGPAHHWDGSSCVHNGKAKGHYK